MLKKMVDGVEIECTPEEEAEIRQRWLDTEMEQAAQRYRIERQSAYPDFATQLDMIYHDRMSGTSTWIDAIQAVKNQYPKPQA